MAMHRKGNSRPVNQSTSLNAHLLVQSQWWIMSLCFASFCLTASLFSSTVCDSLPLSLCRSVLSLCWVSFTGAGPPWFWVWRSCEGWRAFNTQPPCWTWRDCALLAHAAFACSGSTSVRFSPLLVGAQRTENPTIRVNMMACSFAKNKTIVLLLLNCCILHDLKFDLRINSDSCFSYLVMNGFLNEKQLTIITLTFILEWNMSMCLT